MSLYNKASIVLAPGAYKEGRIFNQKPLGEVSDLKFDRGTSGSVQTRRASDDKVTSVGLDIPRINYLGDDKGHLLIEPQSTNVLEYSNNFNQGSVFTGLSVPGRELNVITSPIGDNTGALLYSGSNSPSVLKGIRVETAVVLGEKWTFSYFAKKKDSDWACIIFNADQDGWKPDGARAWFNINNGTLGSTTSGTGVEITSNIDDYGNGWYRCSATCTATADSLRGQVMIALADADGSTAMARDDGTYIFGAQFEKQSFATSYIPTNGSQATRAQEVVGDGGSVDLIGQTEGVFYVEMASLTDTVGSAKMIGLDDNGAGGNNSVVIFYGHASQNQVLLRVVRGNTIYNRTLNLDTEYSRTISQFNRFAIRYGSSGCTSFFNGVKLPSNSNVPNFTNPLTRLSLDTNNFEGKIKCIAVFKEALTDTELEDLTSISTDQILEEYRTHVEGLNGIYENESTMRSTLNGFI